MIKEIDAEIRSKASHITDWMPVSSIPYASQKHNTRLNTKVWWNNVFSPKEVDNHRGIYQVSLTKPKRIIDKDIGYVGKSEYVPYRAYNLKTSTMSEKNTHHQCGRYLRFMGHEADNVFVRVLFFEDLNLDVMEDWIHTSMHHAFSYDKGFAWAEASGGPASSVIRAFDSIARVENIAQLEQIQKYIEKRKALL